MARITVAKEFDKRLRCGKILLKGAIAGPGATLSFVKKSSTVPRVQSVPANRVYGTRITRWLTVLRVIFT